MFLFWEAGWITEAINNYKHTVLYDQKEKLTRSITGAAFFTPESGAELEPELLLLLDWGSTDELSINERSGNAASSSSAIC